MNENALQIIDAQAKAGALICFDRTNGLAKTELYRTEMTAISISKESDCFEINKKFMPKKEVIDRIGEAAGIVFIQGETRSQLVEDGACGKRVVFTGIAQGKVRTSDGGWRASSVCEYEFDPTLRAMLDYNVTELTSQTKAKQRTTRDGRAYGNTLAIAILEYQKTGRQRANTGARLRVIRELVGMPIALTEAQIKRPVLFGRIVQNTDYILQTREGRALATAQALGVDIASLFGGKKIELASPESEDDVSYADEKQAATIPKNQTVVEPDFPEDEPAQELASPEFESLTYTLNEYLEGYQNELDVTTPNGNNPYAKAQDELSRQTATVESRKKMLERIKQFLSSKGIAV